VPMSLAEMHRRLKFAKDLGFRVLLYFSDGTNSDSGAPAFCKEYVLKDKNGKTFPGWKGPDWQICLTPEEMTECVRAVRLEGESRGHPEKVLAPGEKADRIQMRRSIVARRALQAGTVLLTEHLALKRPGTGMDQREVEDLIGKILAVAVDEDEQIRPDHFEQRKT